MSQTVAHMSSALSHPPLVAEVHKLAVSFEKARPIIREFEKAYSTLKQEEDEIDDGLATANVHIDRTTMELDDLRKKMYRQGGVVTEEHRHELVECGEARRQWVMTAHGLRSKKNTMMKAVQEAGLRTCNLLKNMQEAWRLQRVTRFKSVPIEKDVKPSIMHPSGPSPYPKQHPVVQFNSENNGASVTVIEQAATNTETLSSNSAMMEAFSIQFEKFGSISRDVEKARISLYQQAPEIEHKLQAARAMIDKRTMELQDATKNAYKQPGGPTAEQHDLIVACGQAYMDAFTYQTKLQRKKDALMHDRQQAESRVIDLFKETQRIWIDICTSQGALWLRKSELQPLFSKQQDRSTPPAPAPLADKEACRLPIVGPSKPPTSPPEVLIKNKDTGPGYLEQSLRSPSSSHTRSKSLNKAVKHKDNCEPRTLQSPEVVPAFTLKSRAKHNAQAAEVPNDDSITSRQISALTVDHEEEEEEGEIIEEEEGEIIEEEEGEIREDEEMVDREGFLKTEDLEKAGDTVDAEMTADTGGVVKAEETFNAGTMANTRETVNNDGTEQEPLDSVDAILDASEKVRVALKQVDIVRQELGIHQLSYGQQLQQYAKERHRPNNEVASAFGPEYLTRGRKIFRQLCDAENAREAALDKAKALDLSRDILRFEEDNWDLDTDEIRNKNDAIIHNLKRKNDHGDPYEPNRVGNWAKDPYRQAKHQKLRPDRDEAVQLFDYKPIQPSDSISMFEDDEECQERLASMKEDMMTKRQELENTIPNRENLPFADIVTENFEFSGPIMTTTWDKWWVCRRRAFEARAHSRRNSL